MNTSKLIDANDPVAVQELLTELLWSGELYSKMLQIAKEKPDSARKVGRLVTDVDWTLREYKEQFGL